MHLHLHKLQFQELAESCAAVWALRCLFIAALLFFYAPYIWKWTTQLWHPKQRKAKKPEGHTTDARSASPLRRFSVEMLLQARQSLLKTSTDVLGAPSIHLKCVSRSAHIKLQMPNKTSPPHCCARKTSPTRSQVSEFGRSLLKNPRDKPVKNVTCGDDVDHTARGLSHHRFTVPNAPKLDSLRFGEHADALTIMMSGFKGHPHQQLPAHHRHPFEQPNGNCFEYPGYASATDYNHKEQFQNQPAKATQNVCTTFPLSASNGVFSPFKTQRNGAGSSHPYSEKRKPDNVIAASYSVDGKSSGSPRCVRLLSDVGSVVPILDAPQLHQGLAHINHDHRKTHLAFHAGPSWSKELPPVSTAIAPLCTMSDSPEFQAFRQPPCSSTDTHLSRVRNTLSNSPNSPMPHRQPTSAASFLPQLTPDTEVKTGPMGEAKRHAGMPDIAASPHRTAVLEDPSALKKRVLPPAGNRLPENKKLLECVVNFRLLQRHLSLASSIANDHPNLLQTPSSSVLPALWRVAFCTSHAGDVWPLWKEVNAEIRRVLLGSVELQRKDMAGELLRFLATRRIPIERSTVDAFESIVDTRCYNAEQEEMISQWKAAATPNSSILMPTVIHTPSE